MKQGAKATSSKIPIQNSFSFNNKDKVQTGRDTGRKEEARISANIPPKILLKYKDKIPKKLKGRKQKIRMPVESSIYWDSIGSQRSTSVGSSGDAYSSGSASRHYVDPWDLENYVYLRRHSVANLAQQMPLHHRRPTYRLSQEATPAQSEYW